MSGKKKPQGMSFVRCKRKVFLFGYKILRLLIIFYWKLMKYWKLTVAIYFLNLDLFRLKLEGWKYRKSFYASHDLHTWF